MYEQSCRHVFLNIVHAQQAKSSFSFVNFPSFRILYIMVLQNVTTPETRGSAFSMFNLTDDLGKGGAM
jgi:hypothetical protein